ncbi:hypothetical protein [Rufibacter sp. LB8]|uniref:hypothetical protein n=1 Tax=Rufibacter sp. LB8 TaxID=2777781 RepID=UPI00178C28C0|nr:hypothetical protein [Rufibacter sp. LB8]
MKKQLLTLCFSLLALGTFAQDIIIKKTGEEISAKVLEITPEVIKYKRFDYPDGPTIFLLKQEVFMVKYANGQKEIITPAATATPSPTTTGNATSNPYETETNQNIKLGGPRIGFTFITGDLASELKEEHSISPFLTQFGWQFETRVFTTSSGFSGLAEVIPLVAGMEQGKFLPSVSALFGFRAPKGFELGLGPNLSMTGSALVVAVGTNFQSEGINFPVNLAVVPNKDGMRFSLLFGFNSRTN